MSSPINLPPDQDQRDVILNELDTTILVEAAAGTGKTTSMVGRMVNLLARGKTRIDNVAAVTFTRKAAAELRSRFQVHLEQAFLASDKPVQRSRLKEAIENLDRSFIGTIHSFCGRILRERPIEAGVDVNFSEIDDEEDMDLRKFAWRRYVADLYQSDAPILIELENLGVEIGQLEPSFMLMCDYPDVENWPSRKFVFPDFNEQLSALDEYCQYMEKIASDLPENSGNDALIPKYRAIPRIFRQAKHSNEIHDYVSVFEEFLTNPKPVKKIWKKTCLNLDDELARWNFFRDSVATPLVKLWKEHLYEPLLRAIRAGISYYDNIRKDTGKLNFQDLLLITSRLLRDHPEIRSYFRKRYSYLLVDEFQDTDPIQAEVMLYLTSENDLEKNWKNLCPVPGSLFVVGDPKQSIYRFRRADIITYNRVKEIIQSSGGRVVHLSSNFRAVGPIIDWVNAVFENEFKRFPEYASPAYIPLMKGRPSAAEAALEGVRQLQIPKEFSKTEKIVNYDSEVIASFINDCLSRRLSVNRCSSGTVYDAAEAVKPDDFLIITPTMKNIGVYNDKLSRYKIPTEVAGGGSLNSVPELFYLYMLLKTVSEPYDSTALVATLRGPLFGASDTELYHYMLSGGEFNFRATVPESLEQPLQKRLTEFFDKLNSYSRLLRKRTVISAIEHIMIDSGIQLLAAIGPSGNVSAGAMSKTIEILRGSSSRLWTVQDYINLMAELVFGSKKSDSTPLVASTESAVRIMNLHKAKGLEAPIVFLADPTGRNDQKPNLRIDRSQSKTTGFILVTATIQDNLKDKILAAPENWDSFEREEITFKMSEELRLKYVAATRAGSMMVISNRPQNTNKNLWSFFNHKLDGTREVGHRGFADQVEADPTVIDSETVSCVEQTITKRFDNSLENSYEVGSVKSLFTTLDKVSFEKSVHGTEWGLAIHSMLETLMRNLDINADHFRTVTLPRTELIEDLWEDAIETAIRVSRSDIFKRAQNAQRSFVEIPFSLSKRKVDEKGSKRVIRGVIDLVFRESPGWVIVDYKSDRSPESKLEFLVDLYAPQLRGYSMAWADITGEPVIEKGLYFTHHNKYVVVAA